MNNTSKHWGVHPKTTTRADYLRAKIPSAIYDPEELTLSRPVWNVSGPLTRPVAASCVHGKIRYY